MHAAKRQRVEESDTPSLAAAESAQPLPLDCTRWSEHHVANFLASHGLSQYESAFREHQIRGDVLPKLTAAHIQQMGVVAIGDQVRLLESIQSLRQRSVFDFMPDEILVRILAKVGKFSAICQCALVSKRWRKCTMDPKVWTNIVVGKNWPEGDKTFLRKLASRASAVQSLTFRKSTQLQNDDFRVLLPVQPSLTSLTLECCPLLTTECLYSIARFTALRSLRVSAGFSIEPANEYNDVTCLSTLTRLETLHLGSIPVTVHALDVLSQNLLRLSSVWFAFRQPTSPDHDQFIQGVVKYLTRLPCLHEAHLVRANERVKIRPHEISLAPISTLTQLIMLQLDAVRIDNREQPVSLDFLAPLSNLRSVALRCANSLSSWAAFQNSARLRKVRINVASLLPGPGCSAEAMVAALPNVELLHYTGVYSSELMKALPQLSKLEDLTLSLRGDVFSSSSTATATESDGSAVFVSCLQQCTNLKTLELVFRDEQSAIEHLYGVGAMSCLTKLLIHLKKNANTLRKGVFQCGLLNADVQIKNGSNDK